MNMDDQYEIEGLGCPVCSDGGKPMLIGVVFPTNDDPPRACFACFDCKITYGLDMKRINNEPAS